MKDVFDELQKRNLIFPGSIIDVEILEELFLLNRNDKEFVWKKLALKERIKMDGFFVTDRECTEEVIVGSGVTGALNGFFLK